MAILSHEIESWRKLLAEDMHALHPAIGAADLGRAVQATIDRLIFRRICESRGLGQLPAGGPPPLQASDVALQDIIRRIDAPASSYAFQYLDPHVLGQVYERSLGQVIVIRAGRAQVEEKPQVRKAGGVYYTPPSIVEYMVRQTLGKLLEGRAPAQIQGLRVVDPACGAGAFLLGAYRFLLNWYSEREARPLRVDERARILCEHLYGVDIDPQAVEGTKLGLWLIFLEGEGRHARALPELGGNIQCGNAIIGDDYAGKVSSDMVSAGHEVHAFAWEKAFPAVFAGPGGGFGVVLGNPPYLDSELMTQHLAHWRSYCARTYRAASGNWDLFCVFVEKALQIARPGGLVSLIVPNKLASADYAASARAILVEEGTLLALRDYAAVKVFSVAVYPLVVLAARGRAATPPAVHYERIAGSGEVTQERQIPFDAGFADPARPWRIFSESALPSPIERLRGRCVPLAKVARVLGAATVQEAYELLPLLSVHTPRASGLRFINSGLIDRYASRWSLRPCRYIKASFLRPVVLASRVGRVPPRRLQQATAPKLVIAGMTRVIECFIDTKGEWLAGKSTTIVLESTLDLRYLAALVNSKLITSYFLTEFAGNRLQGGYLRIGPPQVRTIPIFVPNTPSERDRHDALLELVDAMLVAQSEFQAAASPPARHRLARTIAALDAQIDSTVYALHGISEAERAQIEAAYRAAAGRSSLVGDDA